MSHQPPPWARPPPDSSPPLWSIDEIKSSTVLQTHPLTRPVTTFGRAADAVTVPTAHESCSRVHARIAFDSTGTAWLRDLGSGNGTTVNGRRLPPKSIGREEQGDGRGEGSRGVVIYPGDAIKFGASTRMFVLNGPAEFDRGAVKAREAMAKAAAASGDGGGVKSAAPAAAAGVNGAARDGPRAQEEERDDGGGVSWGMADDPAENDAPVAGNEKSADGAELSNRPINEADVPPKHRKLYERLLARRYKLQNIRIETERIEAKGAHGDLSEGQNARLEQCRSKEVELRDSLEEMEREVREKIWGGSKGLSGGSTRKRRLDRGDHLGGGDDDDDVDDFYDRTAASSDSRKKIRNEEQEEEGETEQSLTAKWKHLITSLRKKRGDAAVLERRVNGLRARIDAAAGDAADEDAFFLKNDLDIVQDDYDRAASGVAAVEEELTDTERLLRIVNDKLVFDRPVGFVGLDSDHPEAKRMTVDDGIPPTQQQPARQPAQMMPPPPPPPSSRSAAAEPAMTMMPPPPRPMVAPVGPPMPPPPSIGAAAVKGTVKDSNASAAPAAALVGSTVPAGSTAPTSTVSSGPMAPPHPKRTAAVVGPSRPRPPQSGSGGTLAVIRSAASGSSTSSGERAAGASLGVKGSKTSAPPGAGASTSFNAKEDTWRAPKGQDGSGRTKLNAKFEGRY